MIIFLATPAAGGQVSCLYVQSLLSTMKAFREAGMQTMPRFGAGGWTASARNELAGRFFESPADILFFVDSDIGWKPEEAFAVIGHAVETGIAGGHYPKKELDWPKWDAEWEHNDPSTDTETVRRLVSRQEWPHQVFGPEVHRKGAKDFPRQETDLLPTGFLAITRETLINLRNAMPAHLAYLDGDTNPGKMTERFEFFFYGKDEQNRVTGEDVTFSSLVRGCGMKLWKVLGLELQHEGKVIF